MTVNISLILSKLVFFMSSDAQEHRHEGTLHENVSVMIYTT